MSIYRVIDKLESYVKEGTVLPLRYRVLSEERLMEYIEKMRATLPEEVDRAKKITKNQDRVLREAQEKAQAIVTEASSAHSALIDQNEIVRRARTTAETILREAEEKAARTRAGADAYAAQVLAELDNRLSTALGSVKKGLEALAVQQIAAAPQAPKNGAAAPSAPGPLADAAARAKRTAFDAAEETAELESVSPS
jgi:uncharacterized phage infection (PIP) family protein YhgE